MLLDFFHHALDIQWMRWGISNNSQLKNFIDVWRKNKIAHTCIFIYWALYVNLLKWVRWNIIGFVVVNHEYHCYYILIDSHDNRFGNSLAKCIYILTFNRAIRKLYYQFPHWTQIKVKSVLIRCIFKWVHHYGKPNLPLHLNIAYLPGFRRNTWHTFKVNLSWSYKWSNYPFITCNSCVPLIYPRCTVHVCINIYSAGIDFRRHNLTSTDVRIWR